MKKQLATTTLSGILGICLCMPVYADKEMSPAKAAAKYRKSNFSMIGHHMGTMKAMIQDDIDYEAKQFTENAEAMAALSQFIKHGVAVEGLEGKTRAKKKIWSDKAGYEKATADFQKAATNLVEVSKSGDLDKITPAFGAMGKTCKGCHKEYREKKKK